MSETKETEKASKALMDLECVKREWITKWLSKWVDLPGRGI